MRMLAIALTAATAFAGEDAPPRGKLTSGTITLLCRTKHKDYEKATFSFERGIRDDPQRVTRNDWDLLFDDDVFRVLMVTDDRSVIVDLGEKEFADITELPAFPPWNEREAVQAVARVGHAYAVRTLDRDSEHVSVFRVTDLIVRDRCTIEWVNWQRADGPELKLPEATQQRLAIALDAAAHAAVGPALTDPTLILFRMCTGAQGGIESVLALDGTTRRLPDQMEEGDATPKPHQGREPRWSWRGGHVPKGRVLVVESVDVYATAPGDNNGHGAAALKMPSGTVFAMNQEEGPYRVWFEGLELVRPGEEKRLCAEVANSSALEARIRGRLVTEEEARKLEPRPFRPGTAPDGIARAGRGVEARPYLLEQPWLVLQARSGAGGGNPNRITMVGKGSIYLDSVSSEPIDLTAPLRMDEDAVGHTTGGRIPGGKVFVVKKVTWSARTPGDSNGSGGAVLRIGSQEIFRVPSGVEKQEGVWEGAIEVRSGEESEVFLEINNSSVAEAWIEGEWK